MTRLKLVLTTVGASAALAGGVIGVASAQGTASGNISTSGIPRTVWQQDRLEAVAQVLGTSTANVQSARKNHTLSQLVSGAGLTKQSFTQKVKSQLTTELKAQGYSQDQVTIAFQQRTIHRLRHQLHK